MDRVLIGMLAAASMCMSLVAVAQDAPPATQTAPTDTSSTMPAPSSEPSSDKSGRIKPMNRHQMMKGCMSRETAKNDGSTKAQMRKTCKAELMSNSGAQDMMKK